MGAMSRPTALFPTFDTSDFGGNEDSFYFDLVRLQDRQDIPRAFAHRHNYYHLLWMTRAAGTHMLDFEHFDVRDHSVFFVSPGQLHAWASSVRPQGYVLNISAEFFVQMFPRADDIAQFPFFHLTCDTPVMYLTQAEHDALLPLLHEIERETLARHEGRFDIVRSYLLVLLTRLRRLYPLNEGSRQATPAYALTKRFTLLIESHYLDFSSIGEYARALQVSERQLNDAVRRTVGRTASQVVSQRVALEAKRLLCHSDLPITEIAYQLKFDDPAYFARFFRRHTQCTPGEFRRQVSVPMP